MNDDDDYEQLLDEELEHLLEVAGLEALLLICMRLAKAVQINEIEGLSLEQFYLQKRDVRMRYFLAHIADVHVGWASELKAKYDALPQPTSLGL